MCVYLYCQQLQIFNKSALFIDGLSSPQLVPILGCPFLHVAVRLCDFSGSVLASRNTLRLLRAKEKIKANGWVIYLSTGMSRESHLTTSPEY